MRVRDISGAVGERPIKQEQVLNDGSALIQRTVFALIGVCFFCLIAVGQSDVAFLIGGTEIAVPFSGVYVTPSAILLIGPLIMIALAVYLHVLIEEWISVAPEHDYRSLIFIKDTGDFTSRLLSDIIFYWMVPVVLIIYSWKASPFYYFPIVIFVTTTATVSFILIGLRRAGLIYGLNHKALWGIPIIAGLFFSLVGYYKPSLFKRRLYLQGAMLEGKDLRYFDLTYASLSKAHLKQADLSNADLSYANLSNADLSRSEADGTHFNYANLRFAHLDHAEMVSAIFDGSDLSEASLHCISLDGASLQKSNLHHADLTNSYLDRAKFVKANLSNSYLKQADMNDVDLEQSDLTGADLRGAMDLQKEIKVAKINSDTRLPGQSSANVEDPCLGSE